jgi:dTDP-4-amino-4,6-dideoxygalactose transaminase
MTDIQAAIGIHQLARLEDNLKIRERYWAMYETAFRELKELVMLDQTNDPTVASSRHARHLFTVLLPPDTQSMSRWHFIEAMNKARIGTGIHFLALHLSKYYRERFGYQPGDFPNAEEIAGRTVSLPLSASMTTDDIQDVIEAVKKAINSSTSTVPAA